MQWTIERLFGKFPRMKDFTIRKATVNDVERLVRIINAGGPEGKPRKILPEKLPECYWETFKQIDTDPNNYLMVAELNGELIGTFQMTLITYLAAAGRKDCQLEAIHVAEKYRNRGIGSKMLSWAIEFSKNEGCRRIQLTTDKRREDAHRFYERLGFAFTHHGAKLILN